VRCDEGGGGSRAGRWTHARRIMFDGLASTGALILQKHEDTLQTSFDMVPHECRCHLPMDRIILSRDVASFRRIRVYNEVHTHPWHSTYLWLYLVVQIFSIVNTYQETHKSAFLTSIMNQLCCNACTNVL
jgi:hypothetical protein